MEKVPELLEKLKEIDTARIRKTAKTAGSMAIDGWFVSETNYGEDTYHSWDVSVWQSDGIAFQAYGIDGSGFWLGVSQKEQYKRRNKRLSEKEIAARSQRWMTKETPVSALSGFLNPYLESTIVDALEGVNLSPRATKAFGIEELTEEQRSKQPVTSGHNERPRFGPVSIGHVFKQPG